MHQAFSWNRGGREDNDYEYRIPLASRPDDDVEYGDNNNNNNNNTEERLSSSTTRTSGVSRILEAVSPAWLKKNNSSTTTTTNTNAKRNIALRWLGWLLPFYLARPLGLTDRQLPKVGSTTYLNGIRGIACWIVVNNHVTMKEFPDFGHAYGYGPDGLHPKSHSHTMQLPFIRILTAGKGMVAVFFVLSGFVLSFSNLKRMNSPSAGPHDAANSHDLLTSLSSSAVRRAIRLFLPLVGLIFLTAIMTLYMPYKGIEEPDPHLRTSFFVHFAALWRAAVDKVFDPYAWWLKTMPHHFEHAWTLGVEYRASLVVFLVIVFTCKMTTGFRKLFIAFVAWWGGMYADRRWDIACFMGGMLIAEFRFRPLASDVGRWSWVRNHGPDGKGLRFNKTWAKILSVAAVVLGVLFVSWPEGHPNKTQPYMTFWPLAPKKWQENNDRESGESCKWYFATYGAFLLIWGLENLEFMQWALSRTLMIYAGEISYSLYLLQKLMRFYVNQPLQERLKHMGYTKNVAWAISYVVGLFILVTWSDYYWRTVDEGSVKIARWFATDYLGVGKKPTTTAEESSAGGLPTINSNNNNNNNNNSGSTAPPQPPPGPSSVVEMGEVGNKESGGIRIL